MYRPLKKTQAFDIAMTTVVDDDFCADEDDFCAENEPIIEMKIESPYAKYGTPRTTKNLDSIATTHLEISWGEKFNSLENNNPICFWSLLAAITTICAWALVICLWKLVKIVLYQAVYTIAKAIKDAGN